MRETLKSRRRRKLADQNRQETIRAAAFFLTPAMLLIAVYIAWPIVNTLRLSLYSWNGIAPEMTPVGLDNWRTLATDMRFWQAFRNNVTLMILSIGVQLPVGMLLATLLDMGGRRFSFLKTVYFLPMLMSSVAIGFLFRYAYDPQFGMITAVMNLLNRPGMVDVLGNPRVALYGVIAVLCWQFIPFYMVLYLAGLSNVPEELYEASVIDGANRRQYYLNVAIPMMKGPILISLVFAIVGSLKYFDLIWVMTAGGPFGSTELMATYMFRNAFQSYRMGYGATVAAGMFLIITLMSLVTLKIGRRREVTGS